MYVLTDSIDFSKCDVFMKRRWSLVTRQGLIVRMRCGVQAVNTVCVCVCVCVCMCQVYVFGENGQSFIHDIIIIMG